MLVNCAGTSISAKFEEVEVDRFKVGTLDVWLDREAPCRQTQTLLMPKCAFLRSKCGRTLDMLY